MEQFFKFYDIFGGNINMNIHGNNINVISNSLPSQNFIKNIRKILILEKMNIKPKKITLDILMNLLIYY